MALLLENSRNCDCEGREGVPVDERIDWLIDEAVRGKAPACEMTARRQRVLERIQEGRNFDEFAWKAFRLVYCLGVRCLPAPAAPIR